MDMHYPASNVYNSCFFSRRKLSQVFPPQAIQLVLQYAPTLTVDYCLTYLPPQLDQWRDLLDTLLEICTTHDREGNSGNPQMVEVHRSLYKGMLLCKCILARPCITLLFPFSLPPPPFSLAVRVSPPLSLFLPSSPPPSLHAAALNHVLTVTTPEEFLAVLPPSGSVNFYLPFIEHSCKLYLSRQVAEQLHSNSH